MDDLNKAVQDAMLKMTKNGSINTMVEKALANTVNSIINDNLRSYSTFGKALEEKVKKELMVDLNKVSFTEYNKTILSLIEGHLNNAVTEETKQTLKKNLDKLFSPPPATLKLSELIKTYKEESFDFDRDGSEEITLLISEEKYGQRSISLHPTTVKGYHNTCITSWQECDLYLGIYLDKENPKQGKLTRTYDRSNSLKPHSFMPTCMSETSRLLYQMYCAGSVLVFDEGFDPYYYDLEYQNTDEY